MSNPQSWNRYSYVQNNPIKLNDPTGHKCVGDEDGCIPGDGGTGPTKPISKKPSKGSGGTPAPAINPQSITHPTAPIFTGQTLPPTYPNHFGTPNPFISYTLLSTQTPTMPSGWVPNQSSSFYSDAAESILNFCGGPSVPGDPSCGSVAQGIGQALPIIALEVVEPGPAVELIALSGYGIKYACQQNDLVCSFSTHSYTPSYVTPSATPSMTFTPTMTLTPTITPTPTLPFITPTYVTPSLTPTYRITP